VSTQEKSKRYGDLKRKRHVKLKVGDSVLVKSHVLSSSGKHVTSKFTPRRDGPYYVKRIVSPTTYELVNDLNVVVGRYHVKDITRFFGESTEKPVIPLRRRGRPRKIVNKNVDCAEHQAGTLIDVQKGRL